MKNSFVMYTDYIEQMEYLDMEQRGVLFTAIMQYVSGGDMPEMDKVTEMAFSFIRRQIDRDAEKYEEKCEKRREAGKLGGRPRKANGFSEKAKKANGFSEKQTKANESKQKQKNPDNEYEDDNEYENEDDNVVENENEIKREKRKAKKKETVVYYPNDDKLNQAFADYADMRKKTKSAMTDRAVTLEMNKLQKLATDPLTGMMDNDLAIEILNEATMHNWKGLYPLKDNDNQQSRTQRMAQEVDSWTRQSSGNL